MQTRRLGYGAKLGVIILLTLCACSPDGAPKKKALTLEEFSFDPGRMILIRPLSQVTNTPLALPDGYDAWVECDVPVTVNHKNSPAVESRVDSWEVRIRFLQRPSDAGPNLIVKALWPDSQSGRANSIEQRATEQQNREGQFGADGKAGGNSGVTGGLRPEDKEIRAGVGQEWYGKLVAEWRTRNDRLVEVSGPDIKPVITVGTRDNEQTAFWQFSTAHGGVLFGRKNLTLLLLRPTGWQGGFAEFGFRVRDTDSESGAVEYTERIPVHVAKGYQDPPVVSQPGKTTVLNAALDSASDHRSAQPTANQNNRPQLSRAALFVEEMSYWPWKFILISAAVGFALALVVFAVVSGVMSLMAPKKNDPSSPRAGPSSDSVRPPAP